MVGDAGQASLRAALPHAAAATPALCAVQVPPARPFCKRVSHVRLRPLPLPLLAPQQGTPAGASCKPQPLARRSPSWWSTEPHAAPTSVPLTLPGSPARQRGGSGSSRSPVHHAAPSDLALIPAVPALHPCRCVCVQYPTLPRSRYNASSSVRNIRRTTNQSPTSTVHGASRGSTISLACLVCSNLVAAGGADAAQKCLSVPMEWPENVEGVKAVPEGASAAAAAQRSTAQRRRLDVQAHPAAVRLSR